MRTCYCVRNITDIFVHLCENERGWATILHMIIFFFPAAADVSDPTEICRKKVQIDVLLQENMRGSVARFVGHVIEGGGGESVSKHNVAADG